MKDKNEIQSLNFQDFSANIKVDSNEKIDFKKAFEKDILEIPKYAIGAYFWFIPDNSNISIVDISDNLDELTSFKKDEWKEYYPEFLSPIMHPEDWPYFLGGVGFMLTYLKNLDSAARENHRFNIYVRIKNTQNVYRWMVIQFPRIIYNADGDGLSSLIVVTDLSHFDIVNHPVMSLIDATNVRKPFQKAMVEKNGLTIQFANITKRETEILTLMISGCTSPQIAQKLFISYSTVENHKRNLRQKTNCKTSAELIYYVLKNNLI